MPLPHQCPSCQVCAGVNRCTFWQYWFTKQLWAFGNSNLCFRESFSGFLLPLYPTLLFHTNRALFTTIFLPRHNKQHRNLFGTCHYSFTSQMGCCWVMQWTPQPLLRSKHAVSTSSKQENILLLNRFCSLVRRIRIKCIREPHCLKNFRVCYSVSNVLLMWTFHFERFCACDRLWGQSGVIALRRNAGSSYYFQAGNIFPCRTNIYL